MDSFNTQLTNASVKSHQLAYENFTWRSLNKHVDVTVEPVEETSKKFLEELLYTYKCNPELLSKLSEETRLLIQLKLDTEVKVDERVALNLLAINGERLDVVKRIEKFLQ